MNPTDVLTTILAKVLGDPAEAQAYSENPMGYLKANGAEGCNFSQVDMAEVVQNVSNEVVLDPQTTQTLVSSAPSGPYGSSPVATGGQPGPSGPAPSGPAPAGPSAGPSAGPAPAPVAPPPPPLESVETTVNEFVTIVYEGDETIINNIVDNSTQFDVDIDGDVDGDVDLHIDNEVTNATANGEGAVAAGGDAAGIATGDDAIATGGNVVGSQQNTGDGAVQVDGANDGVINTGQNSGIIADGSVSDAQIGDGNIDDVEGSQVVQGDGNTAVGDAENVVSGDGNTVTDVDGSGNTVGDGNVSGTGNTVGDGNTVLQGNSDVNANFGQGDITDAEGVTVEGGSNAAFGNGTVQDNDLDVDGSTHDSFNQANHDTSIDVDASTNDSGNTTIDDSFDVEHSGNTTVEDSFDIEDSFQEAHTDVDSTAVETTIHADDSVVLEADIVD